MLPRIALSGIGNPNIATPHLAGHPGNVSFLVQLNVVNVICSPDRVCGDDMPHISEMAVSQAILSSRFRLGDLRHDRVSMDMVSVRVDS